MSNMHKNGDGFLYKIDSVKHFPLHHLGKSVAEKFGGDDTEYHDIDDGAKEAE